MANIAISFDGSNYSQTSPASPTYVQSNGDIDLDGDDVDNVIISWTLTDGQTFKTNNPLTISGNGKDQIFTTSGSVDNTTLGLSNGNKTYTVADANQTGAANRDFTYTMHESNQDDDPSIKNRR